MVSRETSEARGSTAPSLVNKQAHQPRDLSFLAPHWQQLLQDEFSKPYMEKIRQHLRNEFSHGYTVYPPKEKIFRALKLLDFDQVKVVILGQDPYHGQGQANGLSFAVENGVPAPPSLQNIFKEIESDFGKGRPQNTTLEGIAAQGVLFLNTVLTVRANTPFTHREKGWEIFTDKIIELLNKKTSPIVFLLWGSAAQAKAKMITNLLHTVLTAPHPSPLSAYRGFLGSRHFSKTNTILRSHRLAEINWLA